MYVDIAISNSKSARITVYDDDDVTMVAAEFAKAHRLGPQKKRKLTALLKKKHALVRSNRKVKTSGTGRTSAPGMDSLDEAGKRNDESRHYISTDDTSEASRERPPQASPQLLTPAAKSYDIPSTTIHR